MSELLDSGMEALGPVLKVNHTTRGPFGLLADVFKEITDLVNEQNKGMVGGLCELFVRAFRSANVLTVSSWRALIGLRIKAGRAKGETQEGKGGS